MKRRCLKCSAEWQMKGPIGFREECPECAAFVHTCLNCRLYDASGQRCSSPTTEPVRGPGEVNFCEEFEYHLGAPKGPSPGVRPSGPSPGGRPAESPNAAEEARRRFEDLFRDSKQ